MSTELKQAFGDIGALLVENTFGRGFEIDIVELEQGESYQMQHPRFD